MATWEYLVEEIRLSERWSPKRQAEELEEFRTKMNHLGQQGWEMVSYQSVPLTGGILTDKIRGYAYLAFFKRPT